MNEDTILRKIRQWCDRTKTASTTVGVGDDAAVLTASGRPLVFASDLTIENTHFDLKFSSPADVGYKAVARALSDIAAMGAAPVAVTISVALPRRYDAEAIDRFLEHFFRGAVEISLETGAALAGGDLSRIDGPVVIDVAAVGEVREGLAPWLRAGARPGDLLFVTGSIGGAAFALEELQSGRGRNLLPEQLQKHLRPRPRFDVGGRFAAAPDLKVCAAIDISDGLIHDAYRMCAASNTSLVIEEKSIHLAKGVVALQALRGGDDYELIFALAQDACEKAAGVLSHLGAQQIGQFETPRPQIGAEVFLQQSNGERKLVAGPSLSGLGHDPFRDA